MRRFLVVAGVMAALTLTVALPATPAVASVHGGPPTCYYEVNQGTLASGPSQFAQGRTYGLTTTGAYWSIVGGFGQQMADVDVTLHNAPYSTCNALGTSAEANPVADWIAFDNNTGRLPIGDYTSKFFPVGGQLQFIAGSQTLSTDTPNIDQPLGYNTNTFWTLDIRDVYLTGGHNYSFRVTGGFSSIYLVRSQTNDSTTWTKTRATANARLELPLTNPNAPFGTDVTDISRTGTLTLHDTNVNQWFGFIVVRNAFWGVPVSVRVTTTTP